MAEKSPQPSGFVFPVQLIPAEPDAPPVPRKFEAWGWLELFVLAQVFWGVLLFLPGSQAYRTYIRAFPYVTSLLALAACARSTGTEMVVPGGKWLVAVMALLVFNLVHPETWFAAGVAQIVFQMSIAAPVFWCARMWVTEQRMERVMWLIFAANFCSAALGLLQVYYPATFLPPQFSSLALRMNADFISQLTYQGAAGRDIVRPPGLSDLPGGAAISGTIAALLGFTYAMRGNQPQIRRLLYLAAAVVGVTCIYLTQVRSMLLMVFGCMAVLALIRLRQGRVVQSGWIAATAAGLVIGSFMWAVTVGGDVIQDRFQGIVDGGVMQTYQDNRGFMLDYTIKELPFQYPFGAGLGRWGMMSVYFDEPGNWQNPALYAEIQPTGWLFDGGVLMWVFYGGAIFIAMRYAYTLSIAPASVLNDFATMVFMVQLLIVGLCLTGPVFNTQVGVLFWSVSAILCGYERTLIMQEYYDAQAAAEAEGEAEADAARHTQEVPA